MYNKTSLFPVVQIVIAIDDKKEEYITQSSCTEDSVSKAFTYIKEYYSKEIIDSAQNITIEITKPKFMCWVSDK